MSFNSEVYVSVDGIDYNRLELTKNESILMKYILKDTTNLSKIFSPFSQSFTFKGSLHNQRILNFFGNTTVLSENRSNVFFCKIYVNSLLSERGLLKITDIRYDNGFILSYTGNFTTELLSLNDRIGDDEISDLPTNPVLVDSSPNGVYRSIIVREPTPTDPRQGIKATYYTPLISNNRIFQSVTGDENGEFLDNVSFDERINTTDSIKASELNFAVNGKSIIDMIRDKYNLNVVMPLDNEVYYNDWFVHCNKPTKGVFNGSEFVLKNNFGSLQIYDSKLSGFLQETPKYDIAYNSSSNVFTVNRNPLFDVYWNDFFEIEITLKDTKADRGAESVNIESHIELKNGAIAGSVTTDLTEEKTVIRMRLNDNAFVNNTVDFKVIINTSESITWTGSDFRFKFEAVNDKVNVFNNNAYVKWSKDSLNNDNSSLMNQSLISLYDSIPTTKVTDFLRDFFKCFNISVFTDGNKLFWLTPKDLKEKNKEYTKKEVDYTKYLRSLKLTKEVANDFNYYSFKHKSSKYKSNADYKSLRGVEFGSLSYPDIKPTRQLNEFKVETKFSIIEQLPVFGNPSFKTSYGFTNDKPEIAPTGEVRYTPNTEDLTIFFCNRKVRLNRDERVGFLAFNSSGVLTNNPLSFYLDTSPVHYSGFSFGFGLIQEATERSLYADFYREQTERFLNANTLLHSFELELPANELVLNRSNDTQGESNIPDGFRLQNDVIIQDKRYSIIEATIDKTNGKTFLKLLNY